jgi:hypothetical protein
MDLLIRLIEWLVRSALEQNQRASAPPVSATPGQQATGPAAQWAPSRPSAPAQPAPSRSQPLVTRTAAQDPRYDDRGWRWVLTLLALAVLAILVVFWLTVVMQ